MCFFNNVYNYKIIWFYLPNASSSSWSTPNKTLMVISFPVSRSARMNKSGQFSFLRGRHRNRTKRPTWRTRNSEGRHYHQVNQRVLTPQSAHRLTRIERKGLRDRGHGGWPESQVASSMPGEWYIWWYSKAIGWQSSRPQNRLSCCQILMGWGWKP